jgi:hypothetical protein
MKDGEETEALARTAVTQFEKLREAEQEGSAGGPVASITQIEDFAKLADSVASHLSPSRSRQAGAVGDGVVARGWRRSTA